MAEETRARLTGCAPRRAYIHESLDLPSITDGREYESRGPRLAILPAGRAAARHGRVEDEECGDEPGVAAQFVQTITASSTRT